MNYKILAMALIAVAVTTSIVYAQTPRTLEQVDTDLRTAEGDIVSLDRRVSTTEGNITSLDNRTGTVELRVADLPEALVIEKTEEVIRVNMAPTRPNDGPTSVNVICSSSNALVATNGNAFAVDPDERDDLEVHYVHTVNTLGQARVIYEVSNNLPNQVLLAEFSAWCVEISLR